MASTTNAPAPVPVRPTQLRPSLRAGLWVAVWCSVGYFSGSHIDSIYNAATRYDTYLAIAIGVLVLAWIARRMYRRRRRATRPGP